MHWLGIFVLASSSVEILIINMDRHRRRFERVRHSLALMNLSFTKIPAVDVQWWKKKDLLGYVSPGRWYRSIQAGREHGAVGCILSHLRAFQHAQRSTREYTIVLEDDVVIPPTLREKLESLTPFIRDQYFHILMVGARKPIHFYGAWEGAEPYRSCERNAGDHSRQCIHLRRVENETMRDSKSVRFGLYRSGAWAYVLNNRYAADVLNVYTPPFVYRNDQTRFYGRAGVPPLTMMEANPLWIPWAQTLSFRQGSSTEAAIHVEL